MTEADESEAPAEAEVHRSEYDQMSGLNFSRLALMGKSPAHYAQSVGDDSASFALGTASHMAVLEPERFEREVVVFPGKVRRGAAWDEFETEAIRKGLTVVTASEREKARRIGEAVRRHKRAMELLSGGKPEHTMTWILEGEGFRFECKGRADYVGDALVDLKSTQSSSPKSFPSSVVKYQYLGQAAWYSDGLFLSSGKRRPFYFVAVDSGPPHNVTVYRVSDAQIAQGRSLYLSYLERLVVCQRTGDWGGYTDAPELDLELPSWGMQSEAAQ